MTDLPADAGADLFQLTVRGAPVPDSVEAARTLHNQTAGADANVAAARSLGDLSHNVYTPVGDDRHEMLFLDTWNSIQGLGRFFGNPQVLELAGRLFKDPDRVVWMPAEGFGSYALPSPSGRPPVGLGMLRAPLVSVEAAKAAFTAQTAAHINDSRRHGLVSHQVFMRMPAAPGEEAPLELLALEHWNDLDGMQRFYADLENFSEFTPAFAGTPDTSSWQAAPGSWREW
ncbi:MAG TPA: hypothetical protein VKG45_07975 [Actinomycetes bacterium]|nr:hypothetical protein [Actinomycetes bacterium]